MQLQHLTPEPMEPHTLLHALVSQRLEVVRCLGLLGPGRHWRLTHRCLDNHLLYFMVAGQGHLHAAGQTLQLLPNMLVLVTAGQCYSIASDPQQPLSFYPIHFIGQGRDLPAACLSGAGTDLQPLLPDLNRMAQDWRSGGAGLHTAAARLQLLLGEHLHWAREVAATPHRHDSHLRQIRADLDRNPTARHSIADLAARAGMCRSLFVRRFKELTGLSPSQYMIRRRCEWARILLETEGLRVQEAATACGYPDAYTFSRQFKQIFGTPPSACRQR